MNDERKITFKYHPNIYNDDILINEDGICQCCGHKTDQYIEHIYSAENLDCICLECISNGSAAKKFDATFVSSAETVTDREKQDELFCRTPGYLGWQDEYWLACCDDYCQYIGRVGMSELNEMENGEEILQEYLMRDDAYSEDVVRDCMHKEGDMSGYLFKCLHCGKYHLWVDAN